MFAHHIGNWEEIEAETRQGAAVSGRDYLIWSVCLVVVLVIHGCALVPDSVRPEFEHMSHVSEHPTFTDDPQHFGSEIVSVVAHWDTPKHTYVEIAEGIALDRHYAPGNEYGELIGPREQFSLRIGYVFDLRRFKQ